MLIYDVTDVFWGILDEFHLMIPLYVDTTVYFVAMAAGVVLWTRFVCDYLESENNWGKALLIAGRIFFGFEVIVNLINFVTPILFYFDANHLYHAGPARYATLFVQILMFLMTSAYTLYISLKTKAAGFSRHRAICLFGLAMVIMIIAQTLYPLLPLYAAGYMIGTCLLHSFVVEDEKRSYRKKLEEALEREKQQQKELGSARQLAYKDSLTGIRNKLAFAEAEDAIDKRINDGTLKEFAVVVCDLNGLKAVNDTLGHDAGDTYLKDACSLICTHYEHSPVFRIGGDEFTAILEGRDYRNREAIEEAFNKKINENVANGGVVVSLGTSAFDPSSDKAFQPVFDRADRLMYDRKEVLKSMGAKTRD